MKTLSGLEEWNWPCRAPVGPVLIVTLSCPSGFGAPYGYGPAGALHPYGKLTASWSFGSIIHLFYSSPPFEFFHLFFFILRFSLQTVLSSCPSHQSPHSIPPRHPPLPLLGPPPPPPHEFTDFFLLFLYIYRHWILKVFDLQFWTFIMFHHNRSTFYPRYRPFNPKRAAFRGLSDPDWMDWDKHQWSGSDPPRGRVSLKKRNEWMSKLNSLTLPPW